jgi:hypothetical protein
MAMLAQSLARDLAVRQQSGAPAGESGSAQPTNQQPNQLTNQANQQEALR